MALVLPKKAIFIYIAILTTFLFINRVEISAKQMPEIYFSFGYNKVWYNSGPIQVSQPELQNNYEISAAKGHDRPHWDRELFSVPLTIPQYNYRLGWFINKKKGWGIEINFDHTKFILSEVSTSIRGTLGGQKLDTTVDFSPKNGFFYFLNNGANFLLFNAIKREHIYSVKKFKLDGIFKAGIGPVIPHVENEFFGGKNKPHFQIGGWNMGADVSIRATFYDRIFLEYSNKLDYARYSGLKIYKGTAKHAFGSYQMILTLGLTL